MPVRNRPSGRLLRMAARRLSSRDDRVTRCTEQHLVAALPQSIGQGLDGLGENLVRDRRYDRGHESGSAGSKPSGQQIRDIPSSLDHPAHMLQRAGGHYFRLIEHARDGNRRNARQFGHIPQCEGADRSTYDRTSTKGCGPMLRPSIMVAISLSPVNRMRHTSEQPRFPSGTFLFILMNISGMIRIINGLRHAEDYYWVRRKKR